MPFIPYIDQVEYVTYGITDATIPQVSQATRVANNYLSRPEGVLWSPDANGAPAYMTHKDPSLTLALASGISPGSNVVATLTNPGNAIGTQSIGQAVILDRAALNTAEACIITAVSANTVTLSSVQFSHSSGATMDFGLTLSEEVPLPNKRTTVRLSRTPVAQLLSGFGRYGYGRRSQQFAGPDINTNLLAYVGAFGGPPMWTQFPLGETDINMNTGEVWIPPGLLLAYFSDVRIHYVAGWSKANLPTNIKQAVANIVRGMIDAPLSGNAQNIKAGDAAITRFSATALDEDTKALLQPYRALTMA